MNWARLAPSLASLDSDLKTLLSYAESFMFCPSFLSFSYVRSSAVTSVTSESSVASVAFLLFLSSGRIVQSLFFRLTWKYTRVSKMTTPNEDMFYSRVRQHGARNLNFLAGASPMRGAGRRGSPFKGKSRNECEPLSWWLDMIPTSGVYSWNI